MTSSAAPSSRPTRSADIESITTIIAWGAQVVSVIVSNHVLDASTLVPPSFTDSSSPDVSLNLVSLVRTMNGVILILAVIGFITAFYVVAADNKMGGAVLSVALAGISLSVSLTIGCLVTAEASNPSAWIYLVNVLPAVVLLVSAATLHRHASTPEVAQYGGTCPSGRGHPARSGTGLPSPTASKVPGCTRMSPAARGSPRRRTRLRTAPAGRPRRRPRARPGPGRGGARRRRRRAGHCRPRRAGRHRWCPGAPRRRPRPRRPR